MLRAWMMLAALSGSYVMADQELQLADEAESGEAPSATQVSFFYPNEENPKRQPQRKCIVAVHDCDEPEEVPPNAEDLCYAYEKYSIASYTNTKEKGHFFVTGDAIYWKATEENLGYAALTTQTTFLNSLIVPNIEDTTYENDIKKPHRKYQWGFEVGFGCDFPPESHWDVLVNWTDYRTKAKDEESTPFVDPTMIPAPTNGSYQITSITPLLIGSSSGFLVGVGFYNSAAALWRLHVDLLDLEMGRKFFIGKWVLLRPFFGVRAERIKEKLQASYFLPGTKGNSMFGPSGPVNSSIHLKSNYEGIGIRAGLDSQWKIYRNLSFYADGAASLLYGSEKLGTKAFVTSETTNGFGVAINETQDLIYKNSQNSSRAVFDLDAGFRWDQMFACGRYHLGLNVGWACRYFVDQNQMMRTIDNVEQQITANSGRTDVLLQNNGYLCLQGLVIGGQFDF